MKSYFDQPPFIRGTGNKYVGGMDNGLLEAFWNHQSSQMESERADKSR